MNKILCLVCLFGFFVTNASGYERGGQIKGVTNNVEWTTNYLKGLDDQGDLLKEELVRRGWGLPDIYYNAPPELKTAILRSAAADMTFDFFLRTYKEDINRKAFEENSKNRSLKENRVPDSEGNETISFCQGNMCDLAGDAILRWKVVNSFNFAYGLESETVPTEAKSMLYKSLSYMPGEGKRMCAVGASDKPSDIVEIELVGNIKVSENKTYNDMSLSITENADCLITDYVYDGTHISELGAEEK